MSTLTAPSDPRRPISRPGRAARGEQFAGYAFVSPFFLVFAIFGLFPLLFTFWVSLHDWSLLGDHTWIGLDNYRDLLGDEHFRNALINTVGIFVLATVPQLLMSLVLAQLLNQRLRARTLWRMGILLPNITSIAAVGIIFTLLFVLGSYGKGALGFFTMLCYVCNGDQQLAAQL